MATDIRRMSKEELDELNRLGKEWRERNKPVTQTVDHRPEVEEKKAESESPKLYQPRLL